MKKQLSIITITCSLFLVTAMQAWSCKVGYYTDGLTTVSENYTNNIVKAIEDPGYTPVPIFDISTFDFYTIDTLMINVTDNNGPSQTLLDRLEMIEVWVRAGGNMIIHDRSAGNVDNMLMINATDTLFNRNSDFYISLSPSDPENNELAKADADYTTITTGMLTNSNGFAIESTLPDQVVIYLIETDNPDHVAAFQYPLGMGNIYYSGIPLDYYLSQEDTSQVGNYYRTLYTPKVLTLFWDPVDTDIKPGDNCNAEAIELTSTSCCTDLSTTNSSTISFTKTFTTTDYLPDFYTKTCLSYAPDRVFKINVPKGQKLQIQQISNNFDSMHAMYYDGNCPGEKKILCFNDSDTRVNEWINLEEGSVDVYFIIGAYYRNDSGDFTLHWSLSQGNIDFTWTGKESSSYNDSNNWKVGNVNFNTNWPTEIVTVTIPSNCTYYPVVDGDFVINLDEGDFKCRKLIIMEGAKITTKGLVKVNGNVDVQGTWYHHTNSDIIVTNNGQINIDNGTVVCGSSDEHESDLKLNGSLFVNDGTLSISDSLSIAESGDLSASKSKIQIGCYTGTVSSSENTAFFVEQKGTLHLENSDIIICKSYSENKPGIEFNRDANIETDACHYIFKNARETNQPIYATLNGHDLPSVTLDMDHEFILTSAQNTIGQLTITRGTFRLNKDLSFNGTASPAIVIGKDTSVNNDAVFIVESGTVSVTRNQGGLKALQILASGKLEIQSNGHFKRKLSITDTMPDVIHIKKDGELLINGGTLTLDNEHAAYAWGVTIDSDGLFQMDSGTFVNDAQMHCDGKLLLNGGTLHLVSQTDETDVEFNIIGNISAQNTIFDTFSLASNQTGIHVYPNASIGQSNSDDTLDFDNCTFKNWHPQGVALTVDNTESFTIENPNFDYTSGNSIAKNSQGQISVTGIDTGLRGGEAFDAEPEGYTLNRINWDNTVSISGKENTGTAIKPSADEIQYYAKNSVISIEGAVKNGSSLLWVLEPSDAGIPATGESSPAQVTLLDNCKVTWYSGIAGKWTGQVSSDWGNPDNWHDHKVPTIDTQVNITNDSHNYPVLDQNFSVGHDDAIYHCKSISLSPGVTMTVNAQVSVHSFITIEQATWIQNDSFEVHANGELQLDQASIITGSDALLTVNGQGKLSAKNSSIYINHGLYIKQNGHLDISENCKLIFDGFEGYENVSFKTDMLSIIKISNSELTFKYSASSLKPAISLNNSTKETFNNMDIFIQLKEASDIMYADFGGQKVNNVYIRMPKADQVFKLVNQTAEMDQLFIEKGIFDVNGQNLRVNGDETAIHVGDSNGDNDAQLQMAAGTIEINQSIAELCAMHIYQDGHVLISGGTFSRTISKFPDTFDKVIWIDSSGVFEQSGGTVTIDNGYNHYHWGVTIEKDSEFKLTGGTFVSDSRIKCYGLMNLDGGTLQVASSENEANISLEVFAGGSIEAVNTTFVHPNIYVDSDAQIGTSIGNDADDFDNCIFENWTGSALTFSSADAFTITAPVFNSPAGVNITQLSETIISVTGSTGNRNGEAFDGDPEAQPQNRINWDDTRALTAKSVTAQAVTPSENVTVYYAAETTASAVGKMLTGSVIHWVIKPPEAATPQEGNGTDAFLTIHENADIVWYSGSPGHWLGQNSSDWNELENWSDHRIPDYTIDVVINKNCKHYPVLDAPLYINQDSGTIQCKSMSVASGATLTVRSQIKAYSMIHISGTLIHETAENNAIEIFNTGNLQISNGILTIDRSDHMEHTDIFIHEDGSFQINGQLTTRGQVINEGNIEIHANGSWFHDNQLNHSIQLINTSTFQMTDGQLRVGDSSRHSQTDLLITDDSQFTIESGELTIANALQVMNNANFTGNGGQIFLGTYTGSESNIQDARLGIYDTANFNLNGTSIEIQGSTNETHPGVFFHEQANITINSGEMIFANVRNQDPFIHVNLNRHTLPEVKVRLSDIDHELILNTLQINIHRLIIEQGTVRLNDSQLSFIGGSPAILVGDTNGQNDAQLLVDSGEISINQNQKNLQALIVESDGMVDIQSNGYLERQVSIEDTRSDIIYIKNGGEFYLNGGHVVLNNFQSQYAWGITIDSNALFKINGGTFENDASLTSRGAIQLIDGTFYLASSPDKVKSEFNIIDGQILARDTIFDKFSTTSGKLGIYVKDKATIGENISDDDDDFDGCTFQNWHPDGVALTVDNSESFTIANPTFINADGENISKTAGLITVTGSPSGIRWGEAFDAEFEGSTTNQITWPDTIHLTGRENTAQAVLPANDSTSYYAKDTSINVTGEAVDGHPSLFWQITPKGASEPSSGETSSAQITLKENSEITWYSGDFGIWTGSESSEWNNPSNWQDHKVPRIDTDVTITKQEYSPVLDQSLSINGSEGVYQCKSLHLNNGTITTQASVYCYSLVEMIMDSRWNHEANTMDNFQIGSGGQLKMNRCNFTIGQQTETSPNIIIQGGGALIANNDSEININQGLHMESNARLEVTSSNLVLGKGTSLSEQIWRVDENAHVSFTNKTITISGFAETGMDAIQFHKNADIHFSKTTIIVKPENQSTTFHADFGGQKLNDIEIQMAANQAFQFENDVHLDHLIIVNGIVKVNGQTLRITGDDNAIEVATNVSNGAQLSMTDGEIQVDGTVDDICAMHIRQNGQFLMSGGTFSRNIQLNNSYDRIIWIEQSGVFEQSGGKVILNNQLPDKHWDILIEKDATFRMRGGIFENDAGISCHGKMDLDSGHIKLASSADETNAAFVVYEGGRILAKNMTFSRYSHVSGTEGIHVQNGAFVGTRIDDDDADFDNCQFENWNSYGCALTLSNGESFTMTTPVFDNSAGTNICQEKAKIYVSGAQTGTRGGELFDSDPEGEATNYIHWENTRKLVGKTSSGEAIKPAHNETRYYAAGSAIIAEGKLSSGTVINWQLVPMNAGIPASGESESAAFTINENAEIYWFSGVPGLWIGSESHEWTNPDNWSDHQVPDHTTDVLINNNYHYAPVLNDSLHINAQTGGLSCRSLKINTGASFTTHADVKAYSLVEINLGSWIQGVNSDTAFYIGNGGTLRSNNGTISITQTGGLKIDNGGQLQIIDGNFSIEGKLHLASSGSFEMTAGNMSIGSGGPLSSVVLQVDTQSELDISGGIIDIHSSCNDQALLLDPLANIDCSGGVMRFHCLGQEPGDIIADFGGHSVNQVRIDLHSLDQRFVLTSDQSSFSQLFIDKGTFYIHSNTLQLTGQGPAITIGNQQGNDDAILLLSDGGTIEANQNYAGLTALLIQSDGQFLMTGGQFRRNVLIEDSFDAVIYVTNGGQYLQQGGSVVIDNQSSEMHWGISIDRGGNFSMSGGTFHNDATTRCFGHMKIVNATYQVAKDENEAHAYFFIENLGQIQAQHAVFTMIPEQGIQVKSGALIGESLGDDSDDFDQCTFTNWHALGAALTIENTESFDIDQPVFENPNGMNIQKVSSGQIQVNGQSTGSRGGEQYDSDMEGGLTNYVHWEDTAQLTGHTISGEALQPGNNQTLYYTKEASISATGLGTPLSWEISPSENVSITSGTGSPAEFVLSGDASIFWYSIKPGMWRGHESSDWHDPLNWDDNKVPDETQDVTIPYTYANAPIINQDAVCKNLTLKHDSQLTTDISPLTIKSHLIIENNAQLNMGATTLEIDGDFQNAGIFNAEQATVILGGYSDCQIVPGNNQPITFNRLIIDKQVPAYISFGDTYIQSELVIQTGTPHFSSQLEYAPGASLIYASIDDYTMGTELSDPLPERILFNSNGNIYLSNNLTLENTLDFTKGCLILGNNDLIIREGAVITGEFSKSAMIATQGTGAIQMEINQPQTLFFPTGSITEKATYAPLTLVFQAGKFDNAHVRVQTANEKLPENMSVSNYVDRYWDVSSSGIDQYTCTILADADSSDIQGNINSIYLGRWNGENWYILDPARDTSPIFSGVVNALGIFSAGEQDVFASRVLLTGYLNHFCGVQAGGMSDEQNYAISGLNLISDIVIAPPQQFEISTQSGTGFVKYPNTLRLHPQNANVPETQLYVRFSPYVTTTERVQDYFVHTSENAVTQKVVASGSGLYIRTITLSVPTPVADIQVKVILSEDTFEYDHVLSNGDDIRFSKGNQNLSYWIQEWNPSGDSIIWVRIPDAGISSFDMEYGKTDIAPISSGKDTFIFFDDFSGAQLDTEKWQTKNLATSVNNGILSVSSLNANGGMSSIQSFESSETHSYAAVYQATVTTDNVFILFGFSETSDPWVKRTGIYGYQTLTRYGKQSGATDTSHSSNRAIALYDENIPHLFTIELNEGYGFDDNYIDFDEEPVTTVHAAISTYLLGGAADIDWMYIRKTALPAITTELGSECNMPGGGIWLGQKSGDWSDPENWNTGGAPKSSDNVLISENAPNMPRLTSRSSCRNIEIKRNTTLALSNYQLNVFGEWKNSGALLPQNGAICFQGSMDIDATGLGPNTMIVGNLNDTQEYTYVGYFFLGYKFKPSTDITVIALRNYFGERVSLWTDDGKLLASVSSSNYGGRWTEYALSEPVTLTGNESYVLAAYTGGDPYYLCANIESNFTDGKILESRRSAGNSYPSLLSSVKWWMVDLVYKKGAGSGFENFHQLIIQKTDDHEVALRNVHIDDRLTVKSGRLIITDQLTYSPDAALEYATGNYTTADEFPLVNGPQNLFMNSSGTVHLSSNRIINGRLTLTNGILNIGENLLTLGPDASVTNPSNQSFIKAEPTGIVRHEVSSSNKKDCVFPLGDSQMTPITCEILSIQQTEPAYIEGYLENSSYPDMKPSDSLTSLNRYWRINPQNIDNFTCNIQAAYAEEDIPDTANEKDFMGAYLDHNNTWHNLERVNINHNTFAGQGENPAIISAFEYDIPNSLPEAEARTISLLEDEYYVFSSTDFGFSDSDPFDEFKAIKVTQLPIKGNLKFQSNDIANQAEIEIVNIHQLTFHPGYSESGKNYANFLFQVQDSDLGWSNDSYTITVDVTTINKAPIIQQNSPMSLSVNEDLFETSWQSPELTAGDTDGDTIEWYLYTPPENGTAVIQGYGSSLSVFEYTPNKNYFGNDILVIEARDTAPEPLSDTIVIEINVVPVNDPPVFTCNFTSVTVSEDFSESVQIEVMPLTPPSNESDQVVDYYITPNVNGTIDTLMNATTGTLTLKPFQDQHGTINIDIVASDNQSKNNEARQTIPITVYSVNDPPSFQLDQTEVSVSEDFTQTIVVSVLPGHVPSDETSQAVQYYLSPTQIGFVSLSINSDTGQLSITSISDANGHGVVEIWADDGQPENNLAHQSLMIDVAPINDPPNFYLSKTSIRLKQDFETPEIVLAFFDNQPEDEKTQNHNFTIQPAVSFANVNINPSNGTIRISSVSQGIGSTIFEVTADDYQSQNNIATASFELQVLPDLPPLSIQLTPNIVTVNEDFTTIETIQASIEVDDAHPDRSAVYSITPSVIDFANVSINAETGKITITSKPDKNGNQTFTVEAVDPSDPQLTDQARFDLAVEPVNDPPYFQLSETNIECLENTKEPIIIKIIPELTPEDESAQPVSYNISPNHSDLLEIIVDNLNREIQIFPKNNQNGFAQVTVTASENASHFATISRQFSVTVHDVNSPPEFTVSSQSVDVDEDFGTETITVFPATQPPDEQDQDITYSLSPASLSFVQMAINQHTGELTLTSIKDQFGQSIIAITAHENNVDENADYTQVIDINVYSVNDPPLFEIDRSTLQLAEDFETSETIKVTSVNQPDNEKDQEITYRLLKAPSDFVTISINETTGTITILSQKDKIGSATFSIVADDHGETNNQTSHDITLTVSPVNDPPDFTLSQTAISLMEDFSGTKIIQANLKTQPTDEINHETISYKIWPLETGFCNLSINTLNGIIEISSRENHYGYQRIKVTADDNQMHNNIAERYFDLTVVAVNDPPLFSLSETEIIITEDLAESTSVAISPKNLSEEEIVRYSLTPHSSDIVDISINEENNRIEINTKPNMTGYEDFTITADDYQTINNTYKTTFTVRVEPVNDPPSFQLSDSSKSTKEDFQTPIIIDLYPDPIPLDEKDQTITYEVRSKSLTIVDFSINSTSGQLTIRSLPNANGLQSLTIVANDHQAFNNTYEQVFELDIQPVNDVPSFELSQYAMILQEDFQTIESISSNLINTPQDETGQPVSFQLSPSTCDFAAITINSNSGEVQIQSKDNLNGSRQFEIIADDGQSQHNQFSEKFTITVLPVNDPPAFTLSDTELILNEDFVEDQKVQVNPLNVPSDEENEDIRYSLSPKETPFADVHINNLNGEITIRSRQDEFGTQVFKVIANDYQSTNQSYEQTFTLQIVPINDPPRFTLSRYAVTLDEDFRDIQSIFLITSFGPSNEDNEDVTYKLKPSSVDFAQLTIDSKTGQIDIQSQLNGNGYALISVVGDDGSTENNTSEVPFTLTVEAINDPPVFALSSHALTLTEDFPDVITVSSILEERPVDEMDQHIEFTYYTKSPSIVDLSIDKDDGTLRIQSKANANGKQVITVVADDGQRFNAQYEEQITIYVTPENDPPSFTVDQTTISVPQNFSQTQWISVIPDPVPDDEISQSVTYSLLPETDQLVSSQIDHSTGIVGLTSLSNRTGTTSYTIVANDGNQVSTASFTITVKPLSSIFVNFITTDAREGYAPLTVSFVSQIQGNVSRLLWHFGDGTTSEISMPTHEYAKPGNYNVRLTAFGAGGSKTIEKENYIQIKSRKIQGQVVANDSGQGLPDITVEVWQDNELIENTSTDETGYYTLDGLARADQLIVSAWPPSDQTNYFQQFYNEKETRNQADMLSTLENDLANINFSLQRAQDIGIQGCVYAVSGNSDSGIANVQVDIYSESAMFGLAVFTDNAGCYSISHLKAANDYRVSVWSESLLKDYYYSVPEPSHVGVTVPTYSVSQWHKASLVSPSDPSIQKINIILDETANARGTIAGTVYKSDKTPLAGIWVQASSNVLDDQNIALSNANGQYTITELTPVSLSDASEKGYIVEIDTDVYAYQAYNQSNSLKNANRIETGRTDIDFYLHTARQISGKVTSRCSVGLGAVKVTAWPESGSDTYVVYSDTKGVYELEKLPASTDYILGVFVSGATVIYYPGTENINEAVLLDVSQNNLTGIDMVVLPPAKLALVIEGLQVLAGIRENGCYPYDIDGNEQIGLADVIEMLLRLE